MRFRSAILVLGCTLLAHPASAQHDAGSWPEDSMPSEAEVRRQVEALFTYQRGEMPLGNGLALLDVSQGYKFLDAAQSLRVIHELWGNTAVDEVLGMLIPEGDSLLADDALAFVLQYEPVGRVPVDDADDLDPEHLLARIQQRETEDNARLLEQGYEPAYTVGWPLPPVFDRVRHTLRWGKQLQVGEGEEAEDVLIADARILGRGGVLIANAVTSMEDLERAQEALQVLLGTLRFTPGNGYADFDVEADLVSPWTLSGLLLGRIEEVAPHAPFWNATRITGAVLVAALVLLLVIRLKQRKAKAPTSGS